MSTAGAVGTPATPAAGGAPAAPATPASTSASLGAPAAPAAPAGGAPAAPTAPASGGWMDGFNDDLKGYIGNKGFKDPAALADAYRSFEKMRGVPQDKLVQLPDAFYDDKGALTAEGRAIYERLGAPKAANEYGIEMPKEGGDAARLENFLKAAHEMGLTKAQAQRLAKADTEYFTGAVQKSVQAKNDAFKDQQATLDREWGAAKEQNTQFAKEGMRKMGLDNAKVDALSAAIGHAETMKLLANMGKATGEATFVNSGKTNTIMEPVNAKARIAELRGDKEFGAKLFSGDVEANQTWSRLHAQAFGTDLKAL